MGGAACAFRAGFGVLTVVGCIDQDSSVGWATNGDEVRNTGETTEDTCSQYDNIYV